MSPNVVLQLLIQIMLHYMLQSVIRLTVGAYCLTLPVFKVFWIIFHLNGKIKTYIHNPQLVYLIVISANEFKLYIFNTSSSQFSILIFFSQTPKYGKLFKLSSALQNQKSVTRIYTMCVNNGDGDFVACWTFYH